MIADAEPEVAIGGLIPRHCVVGNGNTRDFYNAGFDGVNEGEVGYDPRKERAYWIAGASEKERCRGKILDSANAEFLLDRLQTGDPKACFLIPLLGFATVFARELCCLAVGSAAIANAAVSPFPFPEPRKDEIKRPENRNRKAAIQSQCRHPRRTRHRPQTLRSAALRPLGLRRPPRILQTL